MKAIFAEKWSRLSTWHAFCSNVRKERYLNVFVLFVCFFHVWREEEREADKEGRGWRETKQEK